MGESNVYELRARQEKIVKLVAVLDMHLVACGVHPFSEAAADHAAHFKIEVWERAAKVAGCNAPSPTTIAAIVAVYRARPAHVAAVRKQAGV
jgi:hypothetical protein